MDEPDHADAAPAAPDAVASAAAGAGSDDPADLLSLLAYRVKELPAFRIVPAPRGRDWMDASRERFANRCLPMLISNQAGWFILNSQSIRAYWTGGADASSLTVQGLDAPAESTAWSHFGHGILTWNIPWLFRTPPGYNLLVRGPANSPKDGACALEGIVETDWSVATFTMNWQITRPGEPVVFERDEPICMIVPQRRGELERFVPEERDLATDAPLARDYAAWLEDREQFIRDLQRRNSPAQRERWEKDYFQGRGPDGGPVPEHQAKLQLREFAGPPPETTPPPRSI